MEDNQYEEDQYEDEFESEEVLSKKTSLQNEKAGLAKPPPQDHFGMERPTSQKIGKRPASRSQLDSKQSATSSVGMNHQEMTQTLKRHNKNAASHEQLAFMGRDVLSSVNIGLKDKLYFVTVYDLPLEALAFEAKEEESEKRHVIELDREDLKLVCGKTHISLLQTGNRMKLAKKVAQWLTDEGPYPVQIISPNAKGTVFYQTIEDRMKIRIAEDKFKVEKEEAERRKKEEQEELKRVKREEAELKERREREEKNGRSWRELVCKRRKKRRNESRRRNVLLRKRRQKRRLAWPNWSASDLRKSKGLKMKG